MTFLFLVTPNWAPAAGLIYGDFGKALKKHMYVEKVGLKIVSKYGCSHGLCSLCSFVLTGGPLSSH